MALIPPGYLNAVVSLGTSGESFQHIGTGFLYAHPLAEKQGQTLYRAYLVTNKHVAANAITANAITHVRFNDPEAGLTVMRIGSVGTGSWTFHPRSADIAVMPLLEHSPLWKGRDLREPGMYLGDVCTTFGEGVQPLEGEGVFVIGFPLGLVGDARNYPIVRYGAIARIQDWVRRHQDTFLIDAPAFPGNSGGPVVLKPETTALAGTRPITHCLLVGVVSKQLRSREVAVSERTGEPRVVFQEDSGLAEVVPVEMVHETAIKEVSDYESQ